MNAVTMDTFDDAIANKIVVVDFWAPWCTPCRVLKPQVERLEREMPDIVFVTLDADSYPDIPKRYGVVGLPTILVFKDGVVVARKNGATGGYAALKQLIVDVQYSVPTAV